jgi:EmrB/QacA subfamily drug resistance transporter
MNAKGRSLWITETNRRWWAVGAMCFALFMIMLDTTAVNVALPSIQRGLHAKTLTLQWIVNSYTLALAVLLVTGGRLGDLFGRRRCFLIGVTIFAIASCAIGISPSANWMVVWRAIQGIGAALLMPATLSVITELFPSDERGKAIGIWTGVSGVALAVGPMVGGLLVEDISWRAIFFLNILIAAGTIVVSLIVVQESRDETATRTVDVPGLLALTVGLTAMMVALVQSNNWHWGSTRELALLALAIVSLAVFALVETHHRAPMVDFGLFRSRTFVGAILVSFIAFFALFGLMFYMSLYMQNIRGYSPFQTGLRFLPAIVAMIFISPLSGWLADRVGPRPLVAGGMLTVAVALLWGSYVTISSSYMKMFVGFSLTGIGLGLALPPISTAAMNAVDQGKAGVASGILSMSRMVGGVFGVTGLGVIMISRWSDKLNHLMPFLPPGASLHMVNNPPTKLELELSTPELLYKGKEAFVYAYQHTMRLGAILPAVGALLAWALIAGRRAILAKSAELEQAAPRQPLMATSEADR